MNNILTIAGNMIKRMIGSVKGLLTFIVFPAVIISVIINVAGTVSETPPVLLYANADQGAGGAHVVAELTHSGAYELKRLDSEAELKEAVISREAESALFIPENYTVSLLNGERPQLSVYELKTSAVTVAVRLKAAEIGDRLAGAASVAASVSAPGNPEERLNAVLKQAELHNVDNVTTDYNLYPNQKLDVVIGFTLMFLMTLVTSTVSRIVSDRKQRTMVRVFSAPVRAYEIAAGNFLGSFTVGFIQIAAVLAICTFGLGFDFEAPLYLCLLILGAFMLVAMGIASTVAGLIRSDKNTSVLNSLILVPTCMLGGCFWPISIMPDYMQKAANFVPQKWAIQAVEIAATGGGWGQLWVPFAVLGLMAAILLAIGSAILRPSEAAL